MAFLSAVRGFGYPHGVFDVFDLYQSVMLFLNMVCVTLASPLAPLVMNLSALRRASLLFTSVLRRFHEIFQGGDDI
jgi:hypothetical protein